MLIDNLKLLKKERGYTCKQIAEGTGIPQRSIERIFQGDTPNPTVDTLRRIVAFLGSSLDEILAEGTFVIGGKTLKALQEEYDLLKSERDLLLAENNILKDKEKAQQAEIEMLKATLKHQEELMAHKDNIIAVHNYYINKA